VVGAEPAVLIGAGVLGLIFGSFATVVAHRAPRRASLGGRSRCPGCGSVVTAAENIPVLSYVVQRGRCRHCAAPISLRYPIIEATTGLLFALSVWRFGVSAAAVVFAAFFWVLVVLSAIDLEHRLLPNRIVLPSLALGWAGLIGLALAGGQTDRLADAAVGAACFGGFLFVVASIYPAGLGFGDVKLALVLGSFAGYAGAPGVVLVGMFLSFLIGSVLGVATIAVRGGGRKTAVPFGPSLALGTVLAILFGRPLFDAYLNYL
jgi:leader peptidase (prepilin peptidase) / N-methyltransferase